MNRVSASAAFRLVAVVPAAALAGLAWTLASGAPLPDDVDAVLDFANRAASADAGGRVALWFEPHVDHRILTTRVAATGQLALTGHVDLRVLAMLGVAALLLAGWMLACLGARRPAAERALALAPVAWLLFQPQAFDALLSPTMGANLLVLPFAFGTLLALRREGGAAFAAALALAGVGAFTQGNGVLVLPAAGLALWWAGRRRAALAWAAAAVLVALAYAVGSTTSRSDPLPLAEGGVVAVATYALAFLGSAVGMGLGWLSLLAGAVVLVLAAGAGLGGAHRRHPWLVGALLFVLLSVAANALGRADLGIGYALAQPRYRIYSALALACCHLLAFERVSGRAALRYASAALAASVAFGLVSYARSLPDARKLAEGAARGLAHWSVTGEWPAHPRPERAAAVLAEARARSTFRVDVERLAPFLDRSVELALPEPTGIVRGRVTRSASEGGLRLIEGHVEPTGFDPARLRVLLVLDGERIVTAEVRSVARRGADGRPRMRFRSLLSVDAVPEEPSRVGLLVLDGTHRAYTARIGSRAGSESPR